MRSMKRWWECFDKLQQEKEEAAESKHAPCQRAWPRCGDQSIDRGKNKVRRSGKNPGKKSSYRSPLNSRNIRQEGGAMQTHNRPFVVTCSLRAFRDIVQIDHSTKEQPLCQWERKHQEHAEMRNRAISFEWELLQYQSTHLENTIQQWNNLGNVQTILIQ